MKINVLVENQAGKVSCHDCKAEWGLSFFIEYNGTHVLFDTGHTDLYVHNARHLDVPLEKTDVVALSHYHWDHVGGLRFSPFNDKKKVVLHPDAPGKMADDERQALEEKFSPVFSTGPYELAPGAFFLGEIPRAMPFEKGMYKDDPMKDDTALAFVADDKTIVVTGCSHSGICNITRYAAEVTGKPVHAVMGGFHLLDGESETLRSTIDFFKKENIPHLHPMHCVDFQSQVIMAHELGSHKLSVGDELIF